MFSDLEKYGEALRECGMRKSVYPRWVESGKMKKDEADRRLAIMDEIAKDYGDKVEKGPPGPLFGG